MSALPVEVRQCPKCEQPAVTLVMEWQHTTFGTSTGMSTKEYRCQHCGAWHVKEANTKLIAYWIVGVLLSIPCGFGAPLLYLAWRQKTFDRRIPLVAAPVPRERFPGGPPKRTCAKCGGVAKAMKITRHTHNGVPTGTDYEYVCGQCGLEFTTENVLGHAFNTFAGLLLGGISAGFFFGAQNPWWKFGGGIVMALFAALMLWQSADRILNRFKHKPLEENVL